MRRTAGELQLARGELPDELPDGLDAECEAMLAALHTRSRITPRRPPQLAALSPRSLVITVVAMTRAGMVLMVATVATTVACANPNVNRAALAASTLSLACDWAQTRNMVTSGSSDVAESNPMLGDRPSARTVDAYFAGALAVNALLWYVLPPRWRMPQAAAVTAIEAPAIASNLGYHTGMCGLGDRPQPQMDWHADYDPAGPSTSARSR